MFDFAHHQQVLDYAPRSRQQRLRRGLTRVAIAVFAVSLITVITLCVRRIVLHLPAYLRQRELASHLDSPDVKVWTKTDHPPVLIPLFAHRRHSKQAGARIVSVEAKDNPHSQPGFARSVWLVSIVETPMSIADLFTPPSPASTLRTNLKNASFVEPIFQIDVLYAGQPDPHDESHFTIDYESKGQRGTIDGWLMPDDSVKLEPRTGPLVK